MKDKILEQEGNSSSYVILVSTGSFDIQMKNNLTAIVSCRETQSKSYYTFKDVERWFLVQNLSNLAFILGSLNFLMSKVEMRSNSSQTGTRGVYSTHGQSTLVIDRNLTLFISSKADVHDSKTCLSTLKSSFLEYFFAINPLQDSI